MAGAEETHVRFSAGGEAAEPCLPDEVAVAGSGRRCGGKGAALRWCISGALCAAFLGLGMGIAVLGPTFDSLAANVHKNVSDMYYIFVGRSMGYLGGSVLGGVLFDCMNAHLLIGLSMCGTTVGLYGIPWCKEPLLLTALMSVIGAAMGFLDTGGNVLALNTWRAEAGPHMQALHFSFAAGAFLAPILAKVALGDSESKGHPVTEKTNVSVLRSVPTAPDATAVPALQHHLGTDFLWSYIIIGTYLLVVALFFFVLYSKASSILDKSKASEGRNLYARYHYALLGLLFVFFFCYVGAEVTYGSYIFTYAKVFAEMKDSKAAALNSVFWGAFAACRGMAIFFAACLYPGTMIVLSLVSSATSSFCLAFFASYPASLWLGTAVYGASMATVFPSGISWAEQYMVVQGKSASLFVVGAALGEMCIPAVVGYLQGQFHHVPVVMYAALVTSVMTVLLFPVMYKLANCLRKSRCKEVNEGEVCKALLTASSSLNEEEEEEEEDDVAEWKEADFEVIEMNNTLRNSVAETSQKTPGDLAAEDSLQSPLENVLHDSSAAADGSPETQDKDADQEKHD